MRQVSGPIPSLERVDSTILHSGVQNSKLLRWNQADVESCLDLLIDLSSQPLSFIRCTYVRSRAVHEDPPTCRDLPSRLKTSTLPRLPSTELCTHVSAHAVDDVSSGVPHSLVTSVNCAGALSPTVLPSRKHKPVRGRPSRHHPEISIGRSDVT